MSTDVGMRTVLFRPCATCSNTWFSANALRYCSCAELRDGLYVTLNPGSSPPSLPGAPPVKLISETLSATGFSIFETSTLFASLSCAPPDHGSTFEKSSPTLAANLLVTSSPRTAAAHGSRLGAPSSPFLASDFAALSGFLSSPFPSSLLQPSTD